MKIERANKRDIIYRTLYIKHDAKMLLQVCFTLMDIYLLKQIKVQWGREPRPEMKTSNDNVQSTSASPRERHSQRSLHNRRLKKK